MPRCEKFHLTLRERCISSRDNLSCCFFPYKRKEDLIISRFLSLSNSTFLPILSLIKYLFTVITLYHCYILYEIFLYKANIININIFLRLVTKMIHWIRALSCTNRKFTQKLYIHDL